MAWSSVRSRLPAFLLAALSVSGCATSPPSQFYLMTPLPEAEAPMPGAQRGPALGVGPVGLPAYLDRPEVVSRTSPNALKLADFNRWGEPLQDGFKRVLAMDLAALAHTDRVSLFPWSRSAPVDYQVTVEVDRFDAGANGRVVLIARWQVLAGEDGRPVRSGRTIVTGPGSDASYEALAAAMSATVATLARDIAAAIPSAASAVRVHCPVLAGTQALATPVPFRPVYVKAG